MTYQERLEQLLKDNEIGMSEGTFQSLLTLAGDMITDPLPRKEVISIQPGDVVTVSYKRQLSEAEIDSKKAAYDRIFPNNQVILYDRGTTLEVYREQEKEQSLKGVDGEELSIYE